MDSEPNASADRVDGLKPYPEDGAPLQPFPRVRRARREKVITLLVSLGFAFILMALLVPAFLSFMRKGRMAENLSRGRQLYLALRNFAHETEHGGRFPTFRNATEGTDPFQNSNEALEILLLRYLDDKGPFFNPQSAWCTERRESPPDAKQLLPGENDWAYVRGLVENGPNRWPLLANAFAPGTAHYVNNPRQPGGVWKGENAIVVWSGGSAEIVKTVRHADGWFVPRSDNRAANAFEPDETWLAGEHVKLLYPAQADASANRP